MQAFATGSKKEPVLENTEELFLPFLPSSRL